MVPQSFVYLGFLTWFSPDFLDIVLRVLVLCRSAISYISASQTSLAIDHTLFYWGFILRSGTLPLKVINPLFFWYFYPWGFLYFFLPKGFFAKGLFLYLKYFLQNFFVYNILQQVLATLNVDFQSRCLDGTTDSHIELTMGEHVLSDINANSSHGRSL